MALNPVVFTEKVLQSFLRYQLRAYPFADPRLHRQMRELLSLDEARRSPLLKGPFVSISRPFRTGAAPKELVAEGLLHPHLEQRIPRNIRHLYRHQEEAIRAIAAGRPTLISTGTGSGKTECFLYPILSRCLTLRDQGAPAGISAVIVYPMNALAEDQLMRLRSLLAGTGVSFGMYVGKTPEAKSGVAGVRLQPGASSADYEAKLAEVQAGKGGETVIPAEEVCSREAMRSKGGQPRILLTNVKQLELLLTRQRDAELFQGARLDYLVFDEAHTFTGAMGAETACLIRRLRAWCGRQATDTGCIATSATIVDPERPDAARSFASRFFGVPEESVATIGEDLEREVWSGDRWRPPSTRDRLDGFDYTADTSPGRDSDPDREGSAALLAECVQAVEESPEGPGTAVRRAYQAISSRELGSAPWPEALYDELACSEVVYQVSAALRQPRPLHELPLDLHRATGLQMTEAGILAWLTLAAAARRGGKPLLRPVLHAFVRGIPGAVVSFPEDSDEARLWLAAEDETDGHDASRTDGNAAPEGESARLPVMNCTTCGQHYYIVHLQDFCFEGSRPGGGESTARGVFWPPLDEALGGRRIVLVDRLIGGGETDMDDDDDRNCRAAGVLERRTAPVHLCRRCSAGHAKAGEGCLSCGAPDALVTLHAIRQKAERQGRLTSCLSCNAVAGGRGRYREPARPVRASNAADVHVLAQDMVQHSERPRLLVFCDNRQDAAFQAGWMKDHARRFRLRSLMADGLRSDEGGSIGDLTWYLDNTLEQDESLSRALIPEVWQVARKEAAGQRHRKERLKFLRMQVLQEVTESARQPLGLEPWGRMKVDYIGLEASLPWVQEHANRLGLAPESMRDGVAGALDSVRRRRILFDAEYLTFTKNRMEGDLEVQQGYLRQFGAPRGVKLQRTPADESTRVLQWISDRGQTTMKQMAAKWGADPEHVTEILGNLFQMLVDRGLLRSVHLLGARGRPLPGAHGVFQVDGDLLRLSSHHGVYRCRNCRARTVRRTPFDRCMAWRCNGVLDWMPEDPDDYDLQLLDGSYSMLRPEEHTAMVPHDERERLENLFKGKGDAVNCFVCTATLELGVDIGSLDAVLMRNVPPLPANYWQRAGRAGRRHRMAVNLTYCRPVSHDRAYFAQPEKLLGGRVEPPAFNLSNGVMVRKHVNASILTGLQRLSRGQTRTTDGPPAAEQARIQAALDDCLPRQVSSWLFDGDAVRDTPFDFKPLASVVRHHRESLLAEVEAVFAQGWPARDAAAVDTDVLGSYIDDFTSGLEDAARSLRRRLEWARGQIERLHRLRREHGSLDPEEDALFRRCDRLVKRLKGVQPRIRRDAEGHQDANTFSVLATHGFLPGYGLETGAVQAMAEIPVWHSSALSFHLPRPVGIALREYVPGNLIYANGHRFLARRFLRPAGEDHEEMPTFEFSAERQAVRECDAASPASFLGAQALSTLAVCDVDLAHQSQISDDEDYRFQMGVAVHGIELGGHRGGLALRWGEQDVQLRHGLEIRLVNVGSSAAIVAGSGLGYPVCTVCGQSVSPLSSERQRQDFGDKHLESCGRQVKRIGFHADVTADAFSLPDLEDPTTAYSVLETLRFGATQVLDMHLDDLQILVIGKVDRPQVNALLWDPMPGGSGLLDQLVVRFQDVAEAARAVAGDCPSACKHSCIDCLQTFRNGYYHSHLSRHAALRSLDEWGPRVSFSHEIPAAAPVGQDAAEQLPVNEAERRLRRLLLAAGFSEGVRGEQISLGPDLGTTTPDVIFGGENDTPDVCLYLDGLSERLHGDPRTAEQDREIRYWLRQRGHEVVEIAVTDLDDSRAMTRHFRRLAMYLGADEVRKRVAADSKWFDAKPESDAEPAAPRDGLLRFVQPTPENRYRTCVPLLGDLEIAAGGFSRAHGVLNEIDSETQWIEVDTGRPLTPDMFAAAVVGRSMEPRIPEGSICLFRSPAAGSRTGRIVLARLRDAVDPETGERFTVKRYRSEKRSASDGPWRHFAIVLEPLNRDFPTIELQAEDGAGSGAVDIVAEFADVLGPAPST